MLAISLLLTALAVQAPSYDTDTTVSVPQGSRLRLQNQGGDIIIKTWDRSSIRVQADHSNRSEVAVDVRGQVVEINVRGRRMGLQTMVDYQLTVPTWMALELGGMYAEISIDGIRAPVKAQTLEGNITLRGGAESVNLSTVNGTIDVTGARGRIELHGVSEDVRVSDAQGELIVESVSGNLDLRRIDSRSVEAQTVSGDVTFEGRLADAGTYSFASHSGDVTMAVPEGTSAAVTVATANGEFNTSFDVRSDREGRRRKTFRLGGGGASVDVETFSGNVNLIRPSELRARRDNDRERERNYDADDGGDGFAVRVRPKIPKIQIHVGERDHDLLEENR